MRPNASRARTILRTGVPAALSALAIGLAAVGPAAADTPPAPVAPATPATPATPAATPTPPASSQAPVGDGTGRKIG